MGHVPQEFIGSSSVAQKQPRLEHNRVIIENELNYRVRGKKGRKVDNKRMN